MLFTHGASRLKRCLSEFPKPYGYYVIVPYMLVCLLKGFIKNVDLVCYNVTIKPLSMVTLRNT